MPSESVLMVIEELMLCALKFSTPAKAEELAQAYSYGMLRKERLVDGAVYEGFAATRFASARWSATHNRFVLMEARTLVLVHPEDLPTPTHSAEKIWKWALEPQLAPGIYFKPKRNISRRLRSL
jgi:hypothetical protein